MNPALRWLFGPEVGMATMGDGRPNNSSADMDALTKAYAAARAKNRAQADAFPMAPVIGAPPTPPISTNNYTPPPVPPVQGLDFPTPSSPPPPNPLPQPAPSLGTGALGGVGDPVGVAPQVPMPQPRPPGAPMAQAPVPLPQARPVAAPPAPMGFFARNTAMMRDPATGAFIDPTAAASAGGMDTTGPQLIQKFMNHFNNQVPGTNPNGSIAGAVGPTSVGGAPLAAPQANNNQGLIPKLMSDYNSFKGLFS